MSNDAFRPAVTSSNKLLDNKFAFRILNLPHVEYFTKRVVIPSIGVDTIKRDTPFRAIPHAGTKVHYNQSFSIEFDVDEDLENYIAVQRWIVGIGFPDDFKQYRDMLAAKGLVTGNGDIYSDCRVLLYNNHFKLNKEVVFESCFPSDLSQLPFDTTSADAREMTATMTLAYSKWRIDDARG